MGAFNTKHDVPTTEKEVANNDQEGDTIKARIEESSVSEVKPRNCSQIDCEPHGWVLPVKRPENVIEKCLESEGCTEIVLNAESQEVLRQSTPVPYNCHLKYSRSCEDAVNANKSDTNSVATVNMTQIKPISLEIKKEFVDENNLPPERENDASQSTAIKLVPNPYALAKNTLNSESSRNVVIKQEMIEKNIEKIESEDQLVFGSLQQIQDNDWVSNKFAEFKEQKLVGKDHGVGQTAQEDFMDRAIKQELIGENNASFDHNCEKQKRFSKWITNPFALLFSLSKGYADMESTQKINKDCINKKLGMQDNDVTNGYKKLIVNSFVKKKQTCKLKEIKMEIESEVDGLSEYHSICNTSFDSLPQISNVVGCQSNKDANSIDSMVRLPEHTNMSSKSHAVKNKANRNGNAGSSYKNKVALPKSKQLKQTKAKINNRSKPNSKSRNKHYLRNKTGIRQYNRKKAMRKGRRRTIVTDKTYYCPIPSHKINFCANRRMRLRARKKENLTNKQILLFPRPLLDEKPQIVSPPPPIQLKMAIGIKWEGLEAAHAPFMLSDNKQYDSKRELDNVENVSKVSDLQSLSHRAQDHAEDPTSDLQKSVKMEIQHDEFGKSTSQTLLGDAGELMGDDVCQSVACLKSMNFNQKMIPTVLGENCKLLKSMQPKVYVKRLSLPKIKGKSPLGRLGFNNVKNEKNILENHVNSKNFETKAHSLLKFETVPVNKVEAPFALDTLMVHKITNLQQTSTMLQKMQPKILLKRLSMSKFSAKSKLVDTCPMDIKEETLPDLNDVAASQNKEKNYEIFSPKIDSITDLKNNCKFLQSMQPKVRLKRLRFEGPCSSPLVSPNHEFNPKRTLKIDPKAMALSFQPRVLLRRLNFGDFKFNHCINNQSTENINHHLKVDLEVKRECNFYEENASYELRKRNLGNLRIKEEKLSPKKCVDPMKISTPQLHIARAFSLQPVVRLNRLKCINRYNTVGASPYSIGQTSANISELGTQIKIESLEVDEEQLTPISFAKQYEEEDSGVSLDSAHNCDNTFDSEAVHVAVGNEFEHNEFSTDDILFEIAFERACINDLLLRNGYSPIQFRLYNDIEELKIFLDYLLVK